MSFNPQCDNFSLFSRISWVEDIIVVVHESQEARMSDIKSKFKHDSVYIAATGDTSTRHRSIHTGVQLVSTGMAPLL